MVKKMKAEGSVGSGHRIRLIGFADALKEHSDIYKDLREGSVTVPGSEFHSIDAEDQCGAVDRLGAAPPQASEASSASVRPAEWAQIDTS